MQYLKQARVKTGELFRATFTSGAETVSHDAACFFLAMEDKGVPPADLERYIHMSELVDPGHDYKEIRRIAATFTKAQGAAA